MTTGEVESLIKFENFATVFIVGGNNIGRVGTMMSVEHHPGSYEIAHVRDSRGNSFATRLSNIFVIGDSKKPLISLPKHKGLRLSLVEERDERDKRNVKASAEEDDE